MRTGRAYLLILPHWKQVQTAVPLPNAVAPSSSHTTPALALGLRANALQFALLMLINTFVGGMVGLERTVMPLIGAETFGVLLNTASDAASPAWRARSLVERGSQTGHLVASTMYRAGKRLRTVCPHVWRRGDMRRTRRSRWRCVPRL